MGIVIAATTAPATADEPAAPSAAAKEQARLHFAAGVNLLRDPEKARFEEAYAELKRAYDLVRSPSFLGAIVVGGKTYVGTTPTIVLTVKAICVDLQ